MLQEIVYFRVINLNSIKLIVVWDSCWIVIFTTYLEVIKETLIYHIIRQVDFKVGLIVIEIGVYLHNFINLFDLRNHLIWVIEIIERV